MKKTHKEQRHRQEAQTVQNEIAQFETNQKKLGSGFACRSNGQPFALDTPHVRSSEVPRKETKLTLQPSSEYFEEICQRLQENAVPCKRREKRLNRFLREQRDALEAQEERQKEEQLVRCLSRQTQQERRLEAYLLQIRKQKDVIQQNCFFREQQYQQQRERDLQEARDRQAALAQQAELDRAEKIRQELELCHRTAAEHAQSTHERHFNICRETLEQTVDLATKVGEYQLFTGNPISEKVLREGKELFFNHLPLYGPINMEDQQSGLELHTIHDPVELKKQELLNNQDYDEYTNMMSEWALQEEAGETSFPPTNNNILGHVVTRLRSIVHPPVMEGSDSFPHFRLKACVLGKPCSGKTTCLARIAQAHGLCVLSADTLLEEALAAYQNREEAKEQRKEEVHGQLLPSPTSLNSDAVGQEESQRTKLSTRALQGGAAEEELRIGSVIPNELMVDIIIEAIRQLPAGSGWVLDGFPVNINQAYLLEKALGGSAAIWNEVERERTDLACDPDPPKLPPAPPHQLDLAVLLNVPDECAVSRALNETRKGSDAATASHLRDTLLVAQIPHRITAFQDALPTLEEWFGKTQNILVPVNADVKEEELYKSVECILQHVMMQIQETPAGSPAEDEMLESGTTPESSPVTPAPVDQAEVTTNQTLDPVESSSRKGQKDKHVKSIFKSNRGPAEGKSKIEDKSSSPSRGSSGGVYVDESLPPEVTEYLCHHWDKVCDSYVNNVRAVMQGLRSERNVIDRQLFNIREEYKQYLGRPDQKQEVLSEWQKDFNNIPKDMREDAETQTELHQRVDDLQERLWGISDNFKEENEQEMSVLMDDEWLEDHTAVLINHHSRLMQVELNRFQDTVSLLRDYYMSMYKQVLPDPSSDFVCISLLDSSHKKEQNETTDQEAVSECRQRDDEEPKRKTGFIPLRPRNPDSSRVKRNQGGRAKPPHEKLISDHKEALTAISKLMSAVAQQWEMDTQEQREKPNKKQKDSSVPAVDKILEVRNKIHKEYTAALTHEEHVANAHITLVREHGLALVKALKGRAEQVCSDMKQSLEEHYLAEMKSIDQLAEVVQHHIESKAKLQNELVLEGTDFYINGDYNLVMSLPPSDPNPPLEEPVLTIIQLESLYLHA
ncbi:sperm flagellar protein 2-like [Aulostomus maculatus]